MMFALKTYTHTRTHSACVRLRWYIVFIHVCRVIHQIATESGKEKRTERINNVNVDILQCDGEEKTESKHDDITIWEILEDISRRKAYAHPKKLSPQLLLLDGMLCLTYTAITCMYFIWILGVFAQSKIDTHAHIRSNERVSVYLDTRIYTLSLKLTHTRTWTNQHRTLNMIHFYIFRYFLF